MFVGEVVNLSELSLFPMQETGSSLCSFCICMADSLTYLTKKKEKTNLEKQTTLQFPTCNIRASTVSQVLQMLGSLAIFGDSTASNPSSPNRG